MKKIKKNNYNIFLILITNCGYTPLINSKKKNFYISEINLEGDRQIK